MRNICKNIKRFLRFNNICHNFLFIRNHFSKSNKLFKLNIKNSPKSDENSRSKFETTLFHHKGLCK